jgi:hypothetical protein
MLRTWFVVAVLILGCAYSIHRMFPPPVPQTWIKGDPSQLKKWIFPPLETTLIAEEVGGFR